MIGNILSDRYHITDVLSSGGMSDTYIADDTQRPGNPKCVVKRLKPSIDDSERLDTTRQFFNREAEALEKLGLNDHIPRLLAYFEHEQEFYLVQELIDGHPLQDEMPLGTAWSEAEVVKFLVETLSVLEFVHQHHVIHRDIKPTNIIRRHSDRKLVLIDFGAVKRVHLQRPLDIAKMGMSQTTATVVIGTPGYMPSEQALGKPRECSDIYALGVTAIQALTGLAPSQLREDEEGELIWRHHMEQPIGEALASLLSKMVRRFHKQRYQTATAALADVKRIELMENDLRDCLLNEPVLQQSMHSTQFAEAHAEATSDAYSETNECMASVAQNEAEFNTASNTTTSPNSNETTTTSTPDSSAQHHSSKQKTVRVGRKTSPTRTQMPAAPTQGSRFQFRRKHIWALGCSVIIGGLCTGTAVGMYKHNQQQQQESGLAALETLKDNQKNERCIADAKRFMEDFPGDRFPEVHQQATDLRIGCAEQQLEKAKEAAAGSSYIKATELAQVIPSDIESVYAQVQGLVPEWHKKIIEIAKSHYGQCELAEAQQIIAAIPNESSVYATAQSAVAEWEAEHQRNFDRLERAQEAIEQSKQNDAQEAIDSFIRLTQPISADQSCWPSEVGVIQVGIKSLEKIAQQNTRINTLTNDIALVTNQLPVLRKTNELLREGEAGVSRLQSNKTLYEDYSVSGTQGQKWRIRLTSETFDTRVFLIDPNGNVIASNDDTNSYDEDDLDSLIGSHTLPVSGTYRIRVNGYSSSDDGRYDLLVERLDD